MSATSSQASVRPMPVTAVRFRTHEVCELADLTCECVPLWTDRRQLLQGCRHVEVLGVGSNPRLLSAISLSCQLVGTLENRPPPCQIDCWDGQSGTPMVKHGTPVGARTARPFARAHPN
eukprot:4242902-Prymnesium_polylepis.1